MAASYWIGPASASSGARSATRAMLAIGVSGNTPWPRLKM